MITATPSWSRKPVILIGTPNVSMKPAYDDTTKSATWKNPFPKLLQNGAAENVKPEEVHEKVTHAEPLSPPNEQEALAETTLGDKEGEGEQYWNSEERPVVESVVSYQIESGLSADLPFNDEVSQHPFTTTNLTPYHVRMTEEPYEAEHKQVETSDSETEAALKPNFKSKTSTPVSEDDLGESVFKKVTGFRQDENILKEDAVEMRQEISCSIEGTYEMDIEDKLYPDGEEMDSWNSVTEKRTDLKTNHGIKKNEEKQQHAEPASMRENEKEIRQDFATVEKDNNLASMSDTSDDDGQHAALDQEHALLPENAEKDNEEDPQNVSLSWRTEPESNSYAQDNTLADTCPLIRYKSDETDSNTQVSHMGESSEDEQEKRIIETGTGMWSEDKSKRFGTMEDLCEEVEGEGLGEEYDLVYTHIEDRGVRHAITVSVHATLGNDTENAEETISKVSEEHSEELSKSMVPTNVDYTEELKADRLVEQKLENLATDSYSAHFAQQQVSESDNILHLQDMSFEEMTEQDEVGKTKTEDMSSCADPEVIANHQYVSSTTVIYKLYEHPYSSDFSLVKPQKESGANEVVQPEDPPEIREKDDEHNVSMVTHADVTEDHSGFSDFISRPDLEETNNKEDPTSVLQVTADQENLQGVAAPAQVIEVVHVEPSCVSQKHLIKDVTHCQKFPEIPETVLEKPSEETDIKHLNNDCEEFESTENDVKGSDEAIMTHKKEPDSVPDENNACVVKDSTKLLNTNDNGQMTTDNGLHGSFSSGVKNDFCMSSLESGATYQPDEAVEQTNKNLGFPDNLFWGNSENTNVSSKALAAKKEKEQMHLEVKQMICRNTAEGELVHSEESEAEGESSSSGEEIVLVL
ncbi:nestin-like [Pempheris klunzingeri]|uniref:nestin-like n=1 Tax=Pempheris klunzingeri TaxID=3127111 RepID=UPI003980DEE5